MRVHCRASGRLRRTSGLNHRTLGLHSRAGGRRHRADGGGARAAGFLRGALSGHHRTTGGRLRTGGELGRTNGDGRRARRGLDGRNRHNRNRKQPGFLSVFQCRPERLFLRGAAQTQVTPQFAQLKYGRAAVAPFDILPWTTRIAGRLQPAFAVPFNFDFARIVSGRNPELGRTEIVDRALQQRALRRAGILCANGRRPPDPEAAQQDANEPTNRPEAKACIRGLEEMPKDGFCFHSESSC